jgi:flagellar hook-associated protein 3 FlgL
MRITEQSRQTNHLRYLSSASERVDDLQRQIATGQRITQPSDDPAGATQAIGYRRDIAFEAQMRRNMDGAVAYMNVTESALSSATDAFQRIRELAVQASNDTLSPSDRQAAGAEVDQLIRHLVQVANTRFGGTYIFAGNRTDQPAYQTTGEPPTAVTYQGDTGQRIRRISESETIAINTVGSTVFGSTFADLIALRDNLNSGAPAATIQSSLQQIDWAMDRVTQARSEIGARTNRIDSTMNQSADLDINLQDLRAEIEEVDLTSAVVRFSSEQVVLQAALGAIGRASNMTLLDFLR